MVLASTFCCPLCDRSLLDATGKPIMTHPVTVLVIDDDEALTAVIREALEDAGCRVVHALGSSSVAVARKVQPDIILLDVLMPRMNGIEISHALRAKRPTAHIPIISMSAHMRGRTPCAMLAEAHLSKPFDLDTLVDTVQHWAQPASLSAHLL